MVLSFNKGRITQCIKVDAHCEEKVDCRKRGQKRYISQMGSSLAKKNYKNRMLVLAHGCGVYSRCEVDLVSQCGGTREWRSAHLGTTCLIETLTEAVYTK